MAMYLQYQPSSACILLLVAYCSIVFARHIPRTSQGDVETRTVVVTAPILQRNSDSEVLLKTTALLNAIGQGTIVTIDRVPLRGRLCLRRGERPCKSKQQNATITKYQIAEKLVYQPSGSIDSDSIHWDAFLLKNEENGLRIWVVIQDSSFPAENSYHYITARSGNLRLPDSLFSEMNASSRVLVAQKPATGSFSSNSFDVQSVRDGQVSFNPTEGQIPCEPVSFLVEGVELVPAFITYGSENVAKIPDFNSERIRTSDAISSLRLQNLPVPSSLPYCKESIKVVILSMHDASHGLKTEIYNYHQSKMQESNTLNSPKVLSDVVVNLNTFTDLRAANLMYVLQSPKGNTWFEYTSLRIDVEQVIYNVSIASSLFPAAMVDKRVVFDLPSALTITIIPKVDPSKVTLKLEDHRSASMESLIEGTWTVNNEVSLADLGKTRLLMSDPHPVNRNYSIGVSISLQNGPVLHTEQLPIRIPYVNLSARDEDSELTRKGNEFVVQVSMFGLLDHEASLNISIKRCGKSKMFRKLTFDPSLGSMQTHLRNIETHDCSVDVDNTIKVAVIDVKGAALLQDSSQTAETTVYE